MSRPLHCTTLTYHDGDEYRTLHDISVVPVTVLRTLPRFTDVPGTGYSIGRMKQSAEGEWVRWSDIEAALKT